MSKGFKKRRLAIALSACLTMTSGVVHALGMGEIEVNTSLNEPLDAKIKLFSATSEELDTLKIEMASQEVFSRMGLDRVPVLRNLQFELVSEGRGAPYIRVSSSKAVKEPFLNFILAVNWANGQMMREFTLLLDPPVFERDQQVGRVSAATTQPAQVIREEIPATIPQPHVAPPGSYGPTVRTDTLWAVARKMRPDHSVSVPQMMIALLKENPEAFDDNNINNLKAGYILRQPEMDVITALSEQEAAAESNRQHLEWQASRGQAPSGRQQRVASFAPAPGAETAPPATAPAAVAAPKTESQGRLQLLSPDEEARIRTGVGSGASGEATESLRQQLAIAQETAEATRQENADLRARLDELERQLQSVQKLLTLKDDTLGALQADAQQEQQPQAQVPAPLAEEQVEIPAAAKQPAPPAAQSEASLLDEMLANPTYLYAAGGGGIILLLVVALITRRRRQDDDDDFTVMTPVAAAPEPTKAAAGKGAAEADVTSAAAGVAAAVAADEEPKEDVAIGDIGGGLGTIHAEESEIDPIAEADVYLAYRRYEQAEALLKEAISADAERHELKLKLLEIYHATKDVDSFEAQAESLYAALGGQHQEIWAQAVEMGRELLPAHPLFSEGGASNAASEVDLGMEFPEGGEEFNFDDESQSLSEDSDELSDDDLAGSLGFAGLGGSPEESGGAESMGELAGVAESETAKQAGAERRDVSLDDLGDLDLELDLDLDLDSSGGLDLGAESVGDDISDAKPRTDDLDFGGEGLEDSMPEKGAFEELQDLAATDVDKGDDIFDLDTELAGSSLDAKPEDFSRDEVDEDEGHPNDGESPYANVDTDSFSPDESKAWQTEAAQSVDVTSETDALLDTAGRRGAPDKGIDMESFSAAPEARAAEADETETVVPENDQATLAEEEFIDPLADIADLGEMDFGDLADEDNDDIFDSSDDMIGTKLDLAKAYIDMGDQDGARSILDEVVEEGDDDQRQEAEQLMQQIS